MDLLDFDYDLPKELIAQTPVSTRDQSKLLVQNKLNGSITHAGFKLLPDFLKDGDVLVINDSKVIPARLIGRRAVSGGSVEVLLDAPVSDNKWLVLGRGLATGVRVMFEKSSLSCAIEKKVGDRYQALFNFSGERFFREIDKIGNVPLPPYIKKAKSEKLKAKSIGNYYSERYQTVYAREKGSVAAPTAGLHFTNELLNKLRDKGVRIKKVTLHVGSGTFLPVKTRRIEDHKMHKEYFSMNVNSYDDIIQAKRDGRRIIAVGTTSARVLEALASRPLRNYESNEITKLRIGNDNEGLDEKNLKSSEAKKLISSGTISGWTDIFIYPGYKFKIVDGLITNFHLPKSTLLMLVSAFTGRENVMKAYQEAIKDRYRFYSFGDAMLVI